MQYLLSVHGPATYDEALNYACEEDTKKAFADVDAFNERLREDGHWVFAGGLEQATTATVVDGQGAEPVITDGPYLESNVLCCIYEGPLDGRLGVKGAWGGCGGLGFTA